MNILVQELPTAVEIDDQEVPINTDFRDCLRAILAFEDGELTATEKRLVLLAALYPSPPPDLAAAFDLGVQFLNGGEPAPDKEPGPRLYSFAQDAGYIFAAFRQTHGIDLQQIDYMHWWAFLALFSDLGQDTAFCQLVALRKRVKTGRASKWERQMYQELGEAARLDEPDTRTADERARAGEFYKLVEEGKRKRAEASAQAPSG